MLSLCIPPKNAKKVLGRSIKLKQLKKELRLTRLQNSVLPGILIGDAHLSTQDHGITCRLRVHQGIKHKEYV